MKYKITNISDVGKRSVLIIYTGGTFGMVRDKTGSLSPFNFGKVVENVPVLKHLEIKLTVISFPIPIDSSNVGIRDWQNMAYIIEENYHHYDGFVVLHGTDTMAYSASMLGYMLEGLNKPVIFTGAQTPIGALRSDARENLIASLEIASAYKDEKPLVSEVCVFFNYNLLRGCRCQKVRSSTFAAFESENYPSLAEAGIEIEYNFSAIRKSTPSELKIGYDINPNVTILKLYPGITKATIEAIVFQNQIKGVVLESFGSGNTMSYDWFINILKLAINRGKIILNISQCIGGHVEQGLYETSKRLTDIGIISGRDITCEAAVTKMMYLFGKYEDPEIIKQKMQEVLIGEMDEKNQFTF